MESFQRNETLLHRRESNNSPATAGSIAAAQKPAPAQPAEQQKLKERVDTLDADVKALREKADRAAMEKDYITRVQKQYETYYEKAFNTMITIFGLISVIIAVIAMATGKLSLNFFDRRAQTAIAEASNQLRTEIAAATNTELAKLQKENASKTKTSTIAPISYFCFRKA